MTDISGVAHGGGQLAEKLGADWDLIAWDPRTLELAFSYPALTYHQSNRRPWKLRTSDTAIDHGRKKRNMGRSHQPCTV
jgi:hypothetical protein